MCQDALTELKMRIRTTGEHKQKIQLQVTVDGLKIKDEKSGVTSLFSEFIQVIYGTEPKNQG